MQSAQDRQDSLQYNMRMAVQRVEGWDFCAPLLASHALKLVLNTQGGGSRTPLVQNVWLATVSAQDRHSHAVPPALLPLHPLLDAAHRMHEREGVGSHDLPLLQGPHMNAVCLCAAASPRLLDHEQFQALQAWASHVKGEHWHFGKAICTPYCGGF